MDKQNLYNEILKYAIKTNNLTLAQLLLSSDHIKPNNLNNNLNISTNINKDIDLLIEHSPIQNSDFKILDKKLDMSYIVRNIGKNSQLMCDIHDNPEDTFKKLKTGYYSLKELNYQNEEGWTLLHYLCRNSQKLSIYNKIIQYLLNHTDINVNLQTNHGLSALMMAAQYSNKDSSDKTVEMLLNHTDIDVNLQENFGSTALMMAARNSNTDSSDKTVEMLLNHSDIDVNLQTNDEWTALMMASRYSNTESSEKTVEMLLNHPNINVNLQNNDGWTALMKAARYSNKESSEKNS